MNSNLAKVLADDLLQGLTSRIERELALFRDRGFQNAVTNVVGELSNKLFCRGYDAAHPPGPARQMITDKVDSLFLTWIESPETEALIKKTFDDAYKKALIELTEHKAKGQAAHDIKRALSK